MNKNSKGVTPILIVVILGTIAVAGYLTLKPILSPSLPLPKSTTSTPPPTDKSIKTEQIEKDGCIISGCNGTICDDEPRISICDARPEYGCYQTATCERQVDGSCDWTQTEELKKCLARYINEPDDSPDGQRKADIYIIRNALEFYKTDSDLYPDSLQTLITNRYLTEIPQDPVTGKPYTYEVSANKLDYTITTTLENGSLYQLGPP